LAGPKIESRKATSTAYVERAGKHDQVPWKSYIERLYGCAEDQKVIPGFYPMTIYHDDPKVAPPERCKSEIAITYRGRANEMKPVMARRMPAMKVASVSHKGQ
jgi:DNA gyrase inhibitor GyrI